MSFRHCVADHWKKDKAVRYVAGHEGFILGKLITTVFLEVRKGMEIKKSAVIGRKLHQQRLENLFISTRESKGKRDKN